MVQEIKLKVSMHSPKCRKEVMKTVTKLAGVDEVSIDLQKEILVVVGDVDPVCVAKSLRKKRKNAEIVSVGPHKKKNKENVVLPRIYYDPPFYGGYGHVFGYPPSGAGGGCNIM